MTRVVAIVALLLAMAAAPAPAAEAPAWLRQAAAATLTPAQAAAPAVVLLDQIDATVSDGGTVSRRRIYAARLRTREGRDAGSVTEVYLTDSGKIKRLKGWIIRPGGEVQELPDTHVLDAALAPNDVYNEARMRVIAAGETEPDTVFGAEVVSEDRAIFTQEDMPFQLGRWPVKSVRRSLTVPAGWTVRSVVFNHDPVAPVIAGSTHSWELADVRALADEASAPGWSGVAPRLAVTYTPDASARAGLATFASWSDVSAWLAGLADPQAAADAALVAKAKALTAGSSTPMEKIRAIAGWMRQVQYISIQIGLGRGGGYRPRRAADVFARNHGDCKDKATLMRAMLAAVGIPSYPAAAFLGDRAFVRPEWPTPQQFNHVILAIAVESSAPYPGAAAVHPTAGPLLFFDPTDPYTRPGALPADEEGSYVLVALPKGGDLLQLPGRGAAGQTSSRTTDGAIQADGTFAGTVTRRTTGSFAARERALVEGLAPRDYADAVSRLLARALPGTRVAEAATRDLDTDVEMTARITVPGVGQPLPNNLVMVTPPFRAFDRAPELTAAVRTLPVVIDGESVTETTRFMLPAGWTVDELPSPASVDTPFGRYRLAARADASVVTVERQLVLERAIVAAADAPALRRFLEAVRVADTSPIVLKRR
jgi:hypothetical protein